MHVTKRVFRINKEFHCCTLVSVMRSDSEFRVVFMLLCQVASATCRRRTHTDKSCLTLIGQCCKRVLQLDLSCSFLSFCYDLKSKTLKPHLNFQEIHGTSLKCSKGNKILPNKKFQYTFLNNFI